jgi:hypothetical protein
MCIRTSPLNNKWEMHPLNERLKFRNRNKNRQCCHALMVSSRHLRPPCTSGYLMSPSAPAQEEGRGGKCWITARTMREEEVTWCQTTDGAWWRQQLHRSSCRGIWERPEDEVAKVLHLVPLALRKNNTKKE